ncbi:MAG: iron dependent repressor, metal binding and dimerization domain protein [Bacillota bacterium]
MLLLSKRPLVARKAASAEGTLCEGGIALLSPSLEDYLEEIYRISARGETVRVTDIAACLGVRLPSVTRALQKLAADGYIRYRPYKDIKLTEKGECLGSFLVERNRIIQGFLSLIGSKCDVVAEAEAIEHYLSLPTLTAIIKFVQFTELYPTWLERYNLFCAEEETKDRVTLTPV